MKPIFLVQTNELTASPRAEYLVNITTPETYTVWLRGYPNNAASDSAYVGIDPLGGCVFLASWDRTMIEKSVQFYKLWYETLSILYWSLLQPNSFRLAVNEGRIPLNRARWEGLALTVAAPWLWSLLLFGLARHFYLLTLTPAGRWDLARVVIALAALLCLVGSVTEGVAFGMVGGLVVVGYGTQFGGLTFPFDWVFLLGATFGMAYRTRREEKGIWWDGVWQALRGGLLFAVIFGFEEGGYLFLRETGLLFAGQEVSNDFFPSFVMAAQRFVSVAWQAGLYFVVPFAVLYVGLFWYPLEALWMALLYGVIRLTRKQPETLINLNPARYDRLIKFPLPFARQLTAIAECEQVSD